MLRGAIAAALTPLAAGGAAIDEAAFEPYVDFLAGHGIDGILALGTTGEGVLFDLVERMRATELFVEVTAARTEFQVAVHCGAQTTADTTALAAHAAETGADAVAVIAPPYYAFDGGELLAHFDEAARACVPLPVIAALREQAPNFVGLKVSDTPWERFEPYVLEGLDIFVGPEVLIPQGFARGAVGAVSGLAGSFPDAGGGRARRRVAGRPSGTAFPGRVEDRARSAWRAGTRRRPAAAARPDGR